MWPEGATNAGFVWAFDLGTVAKVQIYSGAHHDSLDATMGPQEIIKAKAENAANSPLLDLCHVQIHRENGIYNAFSN